MIPTINDQVECKLALFPDLFHFLLSIENVQELFFGYGLVRHVLRPCRYFR